MWNHAVPTNGKWERRRNVGQPSDRIDRPTGIRNPELVAVLAVVGRQLVRWMFAAEGLPIAIGAWRFGIVHDSGQSRAVTSRGGGWSWGRPLGVSPLGRSSERLAANAFFADAEEAAEQAAAAGPVTTANRQTLRNRELGQLGQLENRSKRYKTGMFANLANLAKQFAIETAESWDPRGRRNVMAGA